MFTRSRGRLTARGIHAHALWQLEVASLGFCNGRVPTDVQARTKLFEGMWLEFETSALATREVALALNRALQLLEAFPSYGTHLLGEDDALLHDLHELIGCLPDYDIRAVCFSCNRLGRVISSPPYSRTIRPPSREHMMSSLALKKRLLVSQWHRCLIVTL